MSARFVVERSVCSIESQGMSWSGSHDLERKASDGA